MVFINKQLEDIDQNITIKGNSVSRYLASASEYGIFSGNMSLLTPLAESALLEPDVVSVTVTNHLGTPLIQLPEKNNIGNPPTTNNRVFSKPVIQKIVDINDFAEPDESLPDILGWVVVEISNEIAQTRKQQAIFNSLFIATGILSLSIIIALRISRRVTTPITSLTQAVREIEAGNYDVSVQTQATGELLELEKGIHTMIRSLKAAQLDSFSKIEKTTLGLRESLKVVERQNEELRIARQEALSASEAKSAFLANISHEIRTPMNGILGFIKLLKKSNPTAEQLDYLDTIDKSADNLLKLINDVLDLSKIEAGKLSLHGRPFDLYACVEDVLLLLAPGVYEKNLEITSLFYDDTPRYTIGAEDRIRQILINLVGNAIKFSSRGVIVVRAMLESRHNDRVLIKISVSDQGIGIPENSQKQLFHSFTQLDNSSTRRHEGAGLGLAISKSLAEAMQGDIGVESIPDEGSTFWFSFECLLTKTDQTLKNEAMRFPPLNVFVYDRYEACRLSVCHQLKKYGLKTVEFKHLGELSQEIKQDGNCSLCVIGLSREETRSDDARRILSQVSAAGTVTVLALVNSADPVTLTRIREQGANVCLPKPYRTREFEDAIEDLLGKPQPDGLLVQQDFSSTVHNALNSTASVQHQLSHVRVLIAEDNSINAKLIQTILLQAGATTMLVQNGHEAVEQVCTNVFDIVLMDIHMPGMNGVDATKIIRSRAHHDNHRRIPILGLTANALEEDHRFFLSAGMDDVLIKPISVDKLLREITHWLSAPSHIGKKSLATTGYHHAEQTEGTVHTDQLGVSQELADALFEMLTAELPAVLEQLQAAFDAQNFDSLREQIHRLLGGISYCNVDTLRRSIICCQQSVKTRSPDLAMDFQAMLDEIRKILKIR
ncbi:MAG: response regulator [Gammaproteobacteria bacterium]|nr:response regulator [Gammaproteobacteria bacterium]